MHNFVFLVISLHRCKASTGQVGERHKIL